MLKHRLRRLRLQRGWNLEEFAKRAGISRTTMYLLENGKTSTPRGRTLQRLAETLEVTVEELIPIWGHEASSVSDAHPSEPRFVTESRTLNRSINHLVDDVYVRDPALFTDWSEADWDELCSTFGVGGALTEEGVMQSAQLINRKRQVAKQLRIVLETEHAETAMRFIQALYQLVTTPPMMSPVADDFPPEK